MAVSTFKKAAAASGGATGQNKTSEFSTPAARTWYKIIDPLSAGYHRVKTLVNGNYYLALYLKSTGVLERSITVTSSDQFFTTTAETVAYIWSDTVSGSIEFEESAPLATSVGSGTITRINSSTNFTTNKGGYVLVLGGGGGGGGSYGGPGASGQAGASGNIGFNTINPGTYSVTIGAGGNAQSGSTNPNSGGSSQFGSIVGGGGSAGYPSYSGGAGSSSKPDIITKPFGITSSDQIGEGGSPTDSPRTRPANSGCGGDSRRTNGNASSLNGSAGASGSVWVLEL